MPERIGGADFPEKVLAADIPVLVDFYSDSCIPCKRMSPLLSRLEEEYAGRLRIAKVNVSFEKELVEKYEVQAAPTLIFFRGGEEADRIRGAVTKEQLIEAIEKIIS